MEVGPLLRFVLRFVQALDISHGLARSASRSEARNVKGRWPIARRRWASRTKQHPISVPYTPTQFRFRIASMTAFGARWSR